MSTALDRAFNNSNASYLRCVKATSVSPERIFASGPGGIVASSPSLAMAQEQYLHGSRGWVFSAVSAVAKRIAGQRVCVGRAKGTPRRAKSIYDDIEPLASHPILDILNDPNPLFTQWSLFYSMVTSLLLTGRSNVWLYEDRMWSIPSFWATPKDYLQEKWLVRPVGFTGVTEVEVDGDDMMYCFLPNAADPFGCHSPLQAASAAVSIDENIQIAQFRAFKNGLFPGVMIRVGELDGAVVGTKGELPLLDATQRSDLVAALKKMYGGAYGAGEPLICDALIQSVERITMTPAEMDWIESANHIKSRILQSFGINPMVLGEIEGANRAQAAVAERNFINNVVNPISTLLSSALTEWLGAKHDGMKVWIEPCQAEDDELMLKAYTTALSSGAVSINEFRRAILNLPDIEGGDERVADYRTMPVLRAEPDDDEESG